MHTRTPTPITIVVLLAAVALGGVSCADDDSDTEVVSAATSEPTTPTPAPTTTHPTDSEGAPTTTVPPTTQDTDPSAGSSEALVSWLFRGGLCVVTGNVCESEITLFVDGSASIVDSSAPSDGESFAAGTFSDQVADVQEALDGIDLAELELDPFTDTCPTAYDGQEQTISFPQLDIAFAGCTVVIDPEVPPFDEIDDALSALIIRDE